MRCAAAAFSFLIGVMAMSAPGPTDTIELYAAGSLRAVITTHVRIDIGGQIVTAAITNKAADELKLVVGQGAYAIIKATSVMVAVD
jgi:molybdopterin-binding protein